MIITNHVSGRSKKYIQVSKNHNIMENRRFFEKIDFFNFCQKNAGFPRYCDFSNLQYFFCVPPTWSRWKLRQSDSTIFWLSWNFTFSMKIFRKMHFWAWKSWNFHPKFHWKHFTWCAWPHMMKYTHVHKLFETKIFIAKTGAKTGVFLERNLVKFWKYAHSQCRENAGFSAGFQIFSLIEYHILIDH